MFGHEGGTTGVDNDFAARGVDNIGAWILGRNMFGPIRGAWPDNAWKGWWGDDPPLSRVRANASSSRINHDGRRHDVPFRDRGYSGCIQASYRSSARKGCALGRWGCIPSGLHSRKFDRRNAYSDFAGSAWFRRTPADRHRLAQTGLSTWATRYNARCNARGYHEGKVTSMDTTRKPSISTGGFRVGKLATSCVCFWCRNFSNENFNV